MHYLFFYLFIYFLLSVCDVKNCLTLYISPNGDQHQFSPNNIHLLPRGMVMRVNKMITKEKML